MGSRFSLKGSTMRILASGLVGLALVSGAATSILAQHSSPSAAASGVMTPHGAAIKGFKSGGVVNLATLPAASAAQLKAASATPKASKTDRSRMTPAQLAAYRQWAFAHTGALPKATGAKAPSAGNTYGNGAKPVLTSSHAGLNSVQAGGWYPPDQALAVAPGYIFEGVNNVMEVFTWSYAQKFGPWTPDQLFAGVKTAGDTFSDPQITFDAERSVYLITWLEINGTTGNDFIDIAISKTSTPSPLTNFRIYQLAATAARADNFCDYETLGYDYWAMYVTCVSFSVSGGGWTGNNVYAIDINKLLNGTGIVGWVWNDFVTDVSCGTSCVFPAFRISPTIEDGVPQAEWITATDAGFGVVSQNQTVCAVTNSHALESGAGPTASCIYTSLPLAYDDPVNAVQAGTATGVYPGEGYKQVSYRNGQLYFAMPILINCSGNNHDGILWAAIDPQLSTIAAHNPQQISGVASTYTQAGYFCYTGSDAYMPTLIGEGEGDMTLVFNFSDSVTPPSIVYTGRTASDAPGTMEQGGPGTYAVIGSNSNDSGRFGDYSACALTTNLVTRGIVFCAGEYGGPNTALGGFGWDTFLYVLRME